MNRSSQFQLMLLILLFPLVALGTGNDNDVFEFEAPPKAAYRVGDSLWFGADFVTSLEYRDNLDLQRRADDHLLFVEPEARAVFIYAPGANWLAYTELQLDGRAFLSKGDENDEKSEGHVRIEQLYVDLNDLIDAINVRIGRQELEDERAWWFDDDIDIIRLAWEKDDWFVTASAGREKAFADDLAHSDTDEKVDYVIVTAGLDRGKRDRWTLFLIDKNDRESGRDEDPQYLGVQRIGELGSDLRYWINAALMRGMRGDNRIEAHAADAGFSIRFDGAFRPFVTASLAYGSGDDSTRDGVDGNFRQTGLEDNEARTFGRTSYQYYGEVADFELANLWVGTLGVGFRPDEDTSLEFLYHRFYQVEPDDNLFGTDLETEPNGESRSLGDELDLVFSHRPTRDTKFSIKVGAFRPGAAFDDDDDIAFKAELKWAYRF